MRHCSNDSRYEQGLEESIVILHMIFFENRFLFYFFILLKLPELWQCFFNKMSFNKNLIKFRDLFSAFLRPLALNTSPWPQWA